MSFQNVTSVFNGLVFLKWTPQSYNLLVHGKSVWSHYWTIIQCTSNDVPVTEAWETTSIFGCS